MNGRLPAFSVAQGGFISNSRVVAIAGWQASHRNRLAGCFFLRWSGGKVIPRGMDSLHVY